MIKFFIQNKALLFFLPVIVSLLFLLVEFKYATAFTTMLAFLTFLYLVFGKKGSLFLFLVAGAFLVRILLVLLNDQLGFLPFQPDSVQYTKQAMRILDNVSRNLPLYNDMPFSTGIKSYALFLAQFYAVVGEMPLVAQIVNVILGILSAVIIYKIAILVFQDERIALFALICSLFFPTIIAFTSYVLRDPLVLFLTLLMLYYLILASKSQHKFFHVLFACLLFIIVSIIRMQNLYLYGLFFALFYSYLFIKSDVKRSFKFVFLVGLSALVLFIVYAYYDLIISIANYPLRAQPLRAVGGSAYLQHLQYNSLLDIFKYLPIRVLYFTFGPFLWQANSAFLLLAALEGMLIFAACLFTVFYFAKKRISINFDLQLFLILFCLVGLFANSMVDSNFGTAVRHRMNYIIFFFMFAGAYLRHFRIRLF